MMLERLEDNRQSAAASVEDANTCQPEDILATSGTINEIVHQTIDQILNSIGQQEDLALHVHGSVQMSGSSIETAVETAVQNALIRKSTPESESGCKSPSDGQLKAVGEAFLQCVFEAEEVMDESNASIDKCEAVMPIIVATDKEGHPAEQTSFVADDDQWSREPRMPRTSTLVSTRLANRVPGRSVITTLQIEHTRQIGSLIIPYKQISGLANWLSFNTFFGEVLSIETAHNCGTVKLTFKDVEAAYLYLGLLRFAGSQLPDFDFYFRDEDILTLQIIAGPCLGSLPSRVLLL